LLSENWDNRTNYPQYVWKNSNLNIDVDGKILEPVNEEKQTKKCR
jgi:hypothetical protein